VEPRRKDAARNRDSDVSGTTSIVEVKKRLAECNSVSTVVKPQDEIIRSEKEEGKRAFTRQTKLKYEELEGERVN
jgi:hypothetical protein